VGAPPVRVVLVGLGPVGVRFAEELIGAVEAGTIALTVVESERHDPYNRVQLAEYAVGATDREALTIADAAWLSARGVDVRQGRHAVRIDRNGSELVLDDGTPLPYDRLVLATGARANIPALDGLDVLGASPGAHEGDLLDGVTALRSLADAERVRAVAASGGRVVVLGAGVLGIELVLLLARAGASATIAHFGPIPMPRSLDRGSAAVLSGSLAKAGVQVEPHARAEAVIARAGDDGLRRFHALVTSDGRAIAGDLLVLSCGVTARTGLAGDAGIRAGAGIVVDAELRSWSDPRIFAIGDCAHVADRAVYPTDERVPGGPSGLVGPGWRQAEWLARSFTAEARGAARPAPFVEDVPGVVMLKAEGIELVAAGDVSAEPFAPVPSGETAPGVAMWADPEHGAYTKMVTTAGVLSGFVSVGMPRAAAELSVLYARRGELPADRSLLLRLDGADTVPRAEGRDAPVCMCNAVTAGAIADCIEEGCETVAAVGRATRAGTGCGGCRSRISEMLADAGAREAAPA
jgi:assimilatory nitrate reductase electron transfer subunit